VPGADTDVPMRVVLLPAAAPWPGRPTWMETVPRNGCWNRKSPRIFSAQDGGRWMEFAWKDTNLNFLPEQGLFAGPGPVEVRAADDALEFTGKGWKAHRPTFRDYAYYRAKHTASWGYPEFGKAGRGDADDCAAVSDAAVYSLKLTGWGSLRSLGQPADST